jgi:hypothetical protein
LLPNESLLLLLLFVLFCFGLTTQKKKQKLSDRIVANFGVEIIIKEETETCRSVLLCSNTLVDIGAQEK